MKCFGCVFFASEPNSSVSLVSESLFGIHFLWNPCLWNPFDRNPCYWNPFYWNPFSRNPCLGKQGGWTQGGTLKSDTEGHRDDDSAKKLTGIQSHLNFRVVKIVHADELTSCQRKKGSHYRNNVLSQQFGPWGAHFNLTGSSCIDVIFVVGSLKTRAGMCNIVLSPFC